MPTPLVGPPYEKVSFVPLQTIICRCSPNILRFMMMFGIGNRVECGGCGRYYHIKAMLPDGTTDIGVEIPMATPSLKV